MKIIITERQLKTLLKEQENAQEWCKQVQGAFKSSSTNLPLDGTDIGDDLWLAKGIDSIAVNESLAVKVYVGKLILNRVARPKIFKLTSPNIFRVVTTTEPFKSANKPSQPSNSSIVAAKLAHSNPCKFFNTSNINYLHVSNKRDGLVNPLRRGSLFFSNEVKKSPSKGDYLRKFGKGGKPNLKDMVIPPNISVKGGKIVDVFNEYTGQSPTESIFKKIWKERGEGTKKGDNKSVVELSKLITSEAGTEDYPGKLFVGASVINRVFAKFKNLSFNPKSNGFHKALYAIVSEKSKNKKGVWVYQYSGFPKKSDYVYNPFITGGARESIVAARQLLSGPNEWKKSFPNQETDITHYDNPEVIFNDHVKNDEKKMIQIYPAAYYRQGLHLLTFAWFGKRRPAPNKATQYSINNLIATFKKKHGDPKITEWGSSKYELYQVGQPASGLKPYDYNVLDSLITGKPYKEDGKILVTKKMINLALGYYLNGSRHTKYVYDLIMKLREKLKTA